MTGMMLVCAVFAVCEVIHFLIEIQHFRRENELIRRLASKSETEYVKNYETPTKTPPPPSPAKAAMKRWKAGKRKDD
jgi:hypothetical protein